MAALIIRQLKLALTFEHANSILFVVGNRKSGPGYFSCPRCCRTKLKINESSPWNLSCHVCQFKCNLLSIALSTVCRELDDSVVTDVVRIFQRVIADHSLEHLLHLSFKFEVIRLNLKVKENISFYLIRDMFTLNLFYQHSNHKFISPTTQFPILVSRTLNSYSFRLFTWCPNSRFIER